VGNCALVKIVTRYVITSYFPNDIKIAVHCSFLPSLLSLPPLSIVNPVVCHLQCPFHGVIIPRDEDGKPAGDDITDTREFGGPLLLGADDAPIWQNQLLQQEIMAAKGVDLQISVDKKGKRKGVLTIVEVNVCRV
jgi:hypothetical protein